MIYLYYCLMKYSTYSPSDALEKQVKFYWSLEKEKLIMLDRLQIIKQRFDEISDLIIQPDVIADQKRYVQLNKEYKDLKALVEKRDEYVKLAGNMK